MNGETNNTDFVDGLIEAYKSLSYEDKVKINRFAIDIYKKAKIDSILNTNDVDSVSKEVSERSYNPSSENQIKNNGLFNRLVSGLKTFSKND